MGECTHPSTSDSTSTSFESGQYWDDTTKKWVTIEKKIVTTTTTCTSCGTVTRVHTHTS